MIDLNGDLFISYCFPQLTCRGTLQGILMKHNLNWKLVLPCMILCPVDSISKSFYQIENFPTWFFLSDSIVTYFFLLFYCTNCKSEKESPLKPSLFFRAAFYLIFLRWLRDSLPPRRCYSQRICGQWKSRDQIWIMENCPFRSVRAVPSRLSNTVEWKWRKNPESVDCWDILLLFFKIFL